MSSVLQLKLILMIKKQAQWWWWWCVVGGFFVLFFVFCHHSHSMAFGDSQVKDQTHTTAVTQAPAVMMPDS